MHLISSSKFVSQITKIVDYYLWDNVKLLTKKYNETLFNIHNLSSTIYLIFYVIYLVSRIFKGTHSIHYIYLTIFRTFYQVKES